ncbi:MAG: dihydroorotate dehydrogenase electron transfer subunit [Candidatus Omnitrophica bacterium]|nr:dihydroorotate dehydrogenase electron transfer subunit [Candidatus Omnitrophota bacterium]MBU1869825.1 dihydroorotate dehydrogenase electron transfer subunit [Candidatus Omnitrophota bacterium]
MKKKILQEKAKIISNRKVGRAHFKLLLLAPKVSAKACPGQFVTIKVNDGDIPLLRRPFSVHRVAKSRIEILYEVLGEGTRILSKRKTGEYLDVIGPLGNGFDYKAAKSPLVKLGVNKSQVLVAGGMGVAPLVFLAQRIQELAGSQVKTIVLIGAKTKSQLFCEKEFKNLGCSVKIATDDGSRGFNGRVTGLLKYLLTANGQRPTAVYACGPKPMLKELSRIAREHRLEAQISLEEHMACGIGACLGCVVQTKQGYKRVCKEGPVFNSREIVWDKNKGA